jgi:hypothetical protein
MNSPIVRVIVFSLLFTMAACLVTGLLGLILRWDSSVKFSDGLFFAGSILITLGVLSVLGGFGIRSKFDVQYAQSAGDMSLGERTKRWVADMTQGYNMLVLFLVSGALTIGISVLVGSFL